MPDAVVRLIKPDVKYQVSWLEALQEFRDHGITGFWDIPIPPEDIRKYIERTRMQEYGLDMPTGFVPASTFWMIKDEDFVGHVNIRHELTDFLKRIGGHVGYAIRPSMWRKGYGTRLLELALPEAHKLGLEKVLVTCDENNVASKKIIESSGGIYEGCTSDVEIPKLRYWIPLGP